MLSVVPRNALSGDQRRVSRAHTGGRKINAIIKPEIENDDFYSRYFNDRNGKWTHLHVK